MTGYILGFGSSFILGVILLIFSLWAKSRAKNPSNDFSKWQQRVGGWWILVPEMHEFLDVGCHPSKFWKAISKFCDYHMHPSSQKYLDSPLLMSERYKQQKQFIGCLQTSFLILMALKKRFRFHSISTFIRLLGKRGFLDTGVPRFLFVALIRHDLPVVCICCCIGWQIFFVISICSCHTEEILR